MTRIVTTLDSTGHVVSQWQGGDEQTLAPVVGRTHRPLAAGDTRDYSGTQWKSGAFVAVPAITPVEPTIDEQLWRIETKLDEILSK